MGNRDPRSRRRGEDRDPKRGYNNGSDRDPDADDDDADDDEGDKDMGDLSKGGFSVIDTDDALDAITDSVNETTKRAVRKALVKALSDPDVVASLSKALGLTEIKKSLSDTADLVKSMSDTFDASMEHFDDTAAELKKLAESTADLVKALGKPVADDPGKAAPHINLAKAGTDAAGTVVNPAIGADTPSDGDGKSKERATLMEKAMALSNTGQIVDGLSDALAELSSQGGISDFTYERIAKAVG